MDREPRKLTTFAIADSTRRPLCPSCQKNHAEPGQPIDVIWYLETSSEHLERCTITGVREHDLGIPPLAIRVRSARHGGVFNLPLATIEIVESYRAAGGLVIG